MEHYYLAGKNHKGISLCEDGILRWDGFFGSPSADTPIPECRGIFYLDTDQGRFDGDKFTTVKVEKADGIDTARDTGCDASRDTGCDVSRDIGSECRVANSIEGHTLGSQLTIVQQAGSFKVTMTLKADDETGVISVKPYIENTDSADHIIYSCFPRVTILGNEYEVYTQYTAWCAENQGGWNQLTAGNIVLTNSAGSSSVSCTPFACIRRKDTGSAVGIHVLPIGDWTIKFRRIAGHRTGYTVIEAGLSDAGLRLPVKAGARLEMPEILMHSFSGDIKDCGCEIQRYILPRFPKRHIPDPVFNTWFYNYDVLDVEVLKKQVPIAKKVGCKTFVIDAGWFGTGLDWENQVGCWQESKLRAFKGKMKEFGDYVRSEGMDFGLWMEPERAGRDIDIYKDHPDWFMDEDAIIYDLTKQEVREYLVNELTRLAKTYDLRWMKLDYNTDMYRDLTGTNYYYFYLAERELYKEFAARNPEVSFEGCAGGGARTDIANVFNLYHGHFVSDTVHPLEVLRSRQNVSLRMAQTYMGSWIVAQEVAFPVNTYTDHDIDKRRKVISCGDAWWEQTVDYSMDFIMKCNLPGEYGFSCDFSSFNEANLETIRKANEFGIRYKELLETGVTHLLSNPQIMSDISGWTAMQIESEKLRQSLIFVYRLTDDAEAFIVYPKNIDSDRTYSIRIDEDAYEMSGAEILAGGIRADCPTRYSAKVIELL